MAGIPAVTAKRVRMETLVPEHGLDGMGIRDPAGNDNLELN